jgi:signal transduction histidine kinase
MTESVRFQTRARTIDHLGREQIADCPTAVSELWKNSFDAYSRNASLHIFDGLPEVAAIYDDGHGMSHEEFVNKWLVLGTESKLVRQLTSPEDLNGLRSRIRQGKKGIGRLSAAFLARMLLLVTKRKNSSYVVALIDWRLFENPYLLLDDIEIPISTFEQKEELVSLLPKLFDTLMNNVWGEESDRPRKERINKAWQAFDQLELENKNQHDIEFKTTRVRIEESLVEMAFTERHLAKWSVWDGSALCGTALIMSDIIPDLSAQIIEHPKSALETTAKDNFRSTLWCFSDPFGQVAKDIPNPVSEGFETSVIGWLGERRVSILEKYGGFPTEEVAKCEHVINGTVDEKGVFRGWVKAFGTWLPDKLEIRPAELPPHRADSRVGCFDIYLATSERELRNTTNSPQEHTALGKLFDSFGGLMIFRDGFRVMPYGRSDADFFDIESRRSKHAGREFWNHRRMLGRIAISNFENPNLRDKAGREGIIDNKSSKALKEIVINILQTTGKRVFGTDSKARKEILPGLNKAHEEEQAKAHQTLLLARQRRQFRSNLKNNDPRLDNFISTLDALSREISREDLDEKQVLHSLIQLAEAKQERAELQLGRRPKALGKNLEQVYHSYIQRLRAVDDLISKLDSEASGYLEKINPSKPEVLAASAITTQNKHVRRRLNKWDKEIGNLLDAQREKIRRYVAERADIIPSSLNWLVTDVQSGRLTLAKALQIIESNAVVIDGENEGMFAPLIDGLQTLGENINLSLLATDFSETNEGLNLHIERLTSLAQLGITVEIIGHELESFDSTISYGLANLPNDAKLTLAFKQAQQGHEELTSRLRFLSSLKLSGEPVRKTIRGREIVEYVRNFFRSDQSFSIESTPDFDNFNVYEQPARIFPVFINLINNSRYWLQQSDQLNKTVLLSVLNDWIVISDNGPGVDPLDVKSLFSWFFSKRKGGRGIGLYLCRANLAAGGHHIEYMVSGDYMPMSGANFGIKFREASFS